MNVEMLFIGPQTHSVNTTVSGKMCQCLIHFVAVMLDIVHCLRDIDQTPRFSTSLHFRLQVIWYIGIEPETLRTVKCYTNHKFIGDAELRTRQWYFSWNCSSLQKNTTQYQERIMMYNLISFLPRFLPSCLSDGCQDTVSIGFSAQSDLCSPLFRLLATIYGLIHKATCMFQRLINYETT